MPGSRERMSSISLRGHGRDPQGLPSVGLQLLYVLVQESESRAAQEKIVAKHRHFVIALVEELDGEIRLARDNGPHPGGIVPQVFGNLAGAAAVAIHQM